MTNFRVRAWKVYYADGSTYSCRDGKMADRPVKGILHLFLAFEPNGKMSGYVLSGCEVYPYIEVGDEMTPGMTVSHEEYESTMKEAAHALREFD